jgi:long-chain acyl-CoA synthetase
VPEGIGGSDVWDQRLGVWWIAEDHPDALAVAHSPTGPLTYAQLVGRTHQLVHALRALGLEPGDGVAVMLPNGVEIVEASLATQEAGWMFTPLNTYLTAAEVALLLESSQARALVVHPRFAAVVDALVIETASVIGTHVLSMGGAIDGIQSLDDLADAQPTTEPPDRTAGALFPFTSGTTGKPKGIKRRSADVDPSKAAHAGALFGRAFDFIPFAGTQLVSTAMYHGGSHSFYMAALNVGQPLVIMDGFDPEETLRLIEQYRVVAGYMVPTQFNRLVRLPEDVRDKYDLSSLHSIVHAAAPCPRPLKEEMMAWWGPVIWETYGGMEGAATIAKPERWLERPGTVGRAIKGVTLWVLDEEGTPLPAGEVGAIYIENEVGFQYHGDEEGTRSAFKGRRFTLGDIGYLDDGGYLFLLDRAKDMIISGGVNIFPAEIEAVLGAHPAVADVGVIGVPDADWGEQVKAVVQPAPGYGAGPELAAELLAYAREHLAAYKVPRSVDFRTEMPRTDAGKLYKRQIRDEYWAAAGRSL